MFTVAGVIIIVPAMAYLIFFMSFYLKFIGKFFCFRVAFLLEDFFLNDGAKI